MCKKHQDQLLPVHPPFPSFAWVMTAQANPPTPAYAYGYVQNVHTRRTRIPARRVAPPGRHRPCPHSSRPLPSPARAKVEARDGRFMETVDYRYHDDPPLRPYVPWLEGYTLRGRGAQQLRQRQQQLQKEFLPLDLTVAARAPAQTPPAVATTVSKCGFVGSSDDVRPKKRMTVDVVKFKRLDVALSALRRACGLSIRA
ncbi:hypothetical protein DFH94DRAFT_103683 [Russula ochroleuca]|jgi:hypothetical protein|uniref:Uncharacterized protein n=1 Tax=Russula ochroleuca TaxID=152965 RepID=A0A9P5MSF8_9AGAM|nr:hypothetical protein DFH94DRAFT_103683 [Russula ochroleuca]